MKQLVVPLATCLLAVGCASSAATSTDSRHKATVMLHAALKPDALGGQGSKLSQDAIKRSGVVWANYIPGQGVYVGVDSPQDEGAIKDFLTANAAVESVSEEPAPSAMPTAGKS